MFTFLAGFLSSLILTSSLCVLYISSVERNASLASVDMFTKFKRGADCLVKIVIWVRA
jgi:hypothetical protein